VTLWDLQSGQPTQTLEGHTRAVYSVAWSADGQLASGSGDGTVILWDLNTGQPAQTLKGHTGTVASVAWSADAQLASGSGDSTVIFWDLNTGQPAQTLMGHVGAVYSVTWSADGQLASGSWDNNIKMSRADLTGDNLCDRILRNLSIEEWLDYQGALYIYKPACPNLHNPTAAINPIELLINAPLDPATYRVLLITWNGRAILLALLLLFLAIAGLMIWVLRRLVANLWRKIRQRKQLPSGI
jgi:WD40 repeat protein